ncbi:MAG: sel1 repeat family protein, partial [Rhodospirillales bacterium]|nr:sel1 repeat family protein [Rhodospirillales bacterium]
MAIVDRLIGTLSPTAALRQAVKLSAKGDVKRAAPLFSRAARAGIAEAQHRLARCYLEGAGVPHSRPEGVRWLER